MKYEKKILESVLDCLLEEVIKEIYYYSNYEGYQVFDQLPLNVQHVPLLGIRIETQTGICLNIIGTDYSPYYGLGGIDALINDKLENPRPKNIDKSVYVDYRNAKIISYSIYETVYQVDFDNIKVPFGIRLNFENELSLFIVNMGIESYDAENKILEFSHGGDDLTILFNEAAAIQYAKWQI